MSTGFKNPIEAKAEKSIKSPWNFDAPPYDERSSCYVNAGSHYGVGHTQPVGKVGNPKQEAATLPKDRRNVKTMEVSQVPKKNLREEIFE